MMIPKLTGTPQNQRLLPPSSTNGEKTALTRPLLGGGGEYRMLERSGNVLEAAKKKLPSLSHNKSLAHVPPTDGVDFSEVEAGAVSALVDAWVDRVNQLNAEIPLGAIEDYTFSHLIFSEAYGTEALSEPFFPPQIPLPDGRTLQCLGAGFGRAVFAVGDKAFKTTWKTSQAEMREEIQKYQKSRRMLERLGAEGHFALDRIVPITQSFQIPASDFASKLDGALPPDDRIFIVMDKLTAPTMKAAMEAKLEQGEFPTYTRAELQELGRLFFDCAKAGILLQGDAADFVYDETAPEGARMMAIDPAGWTLFDVETAEDRALVMHLAAKSFIGTFLRELGRIPMPEEDAMAFEPNAYDPRHDRALETLKKQVFSTIDEIWGAQARRPSAAEAKLQTALEGDVLAHPYLREMVVYEMEDPRALAEALVHCGIGVVITHRDLMTQMHEVRQSQDNPRTLSSGEDGMYWADTTSIGFGNHQGFVDEKSGFAVFYNPYTNGNADGDTIEAQRPHVPWHFVDTKTVAKKMLARLSAAGSVIGEPPRGWLDRS